MSSEHLVVNADIAVPFSAARGLLTKLRAGGLAIDSPQARPITHHAPTADESLSDRQDQDTQLRYYTKHRALRGFRFVSEQIARAFDAGLELRTTGMLHDSDRQFFTVLGETMPLRLTIEVGAPTDAEAAATDPESVWFKELSAAVAAGKLADESVHRALSKLLQCGDSWSAIELAERYLRTQRTVSSRLADVFGLAFALQDRTADAERLFERWGSGDQLASARAKYSLSMLYARHHPLVWLDSALAETLLESAWDDLAAVDSASDQVRYEQIFNRNGLALMLFRQAEFDRAASLLEEGLESLAATPFVNTVHHTVLLNNLGRVHAARGAAAEAERALREAIEIDPRFAEYWQDLASFLVDQERADEALVAIDRAIALDPVIGEAHALRGYVLTKLRDQAGAIDAYLRADALGLAGHAVDAMRAAAESDDYRRVRDIAATARVDRWSVRNQAEAAVLLLEADLSDGTCADPVARLQNLRERFPDDELVRENLERLA